MNRLARLALSLCAAATLLQGCAGPGAGEADDSSGLTAAATPPPVAYAGGGVVHAAGVHVIYWGADVDPATVSAVSGFYSTVLGRNPYMEMLSEFSVPGATVGQPSYAGAYVDIDAPVPAASGALTVTDQQVQAELVRLINQGLLQGLLPANDGNNIFMIYFPPGVTISAPWGNSCADWCAYHSDFQRDHLVASDRSADILYGVVPDFSSSKNACAQSCAVGSESYLQALESASSHELVETITDPIYPLGWIDTADAADGADQEVGDLCAFVPADAPEGNVSGYTVQRIWSVEGQSCRSARADSEVFLSATPAQVKVAAGSTVTLTVTAVAPASGKVNPRPLKLGLDDFFGNLSGVTATFTPASISVGQSAKVKLTVPKATPPITSAFFIHGYDALDGEYHIVRPVLAVSNPAPVVKSYAPMQGSALGGAAVTLKLKGNALAVAPTAVVSNSAHRIPALAALDAAGDVVVTMPGFPLAAGRASASVQLTLTNPDGNSVSVPFTFLRPATSAAPEITALTVASGPTAGGSVLGISGSGFGASAADSSGAFAWPQVLFGDRAGTIVSYDPSRSPPLLTVKAPAGAAAGDVALTIVNASGARSSAATFHYGSAPAPQLQSAALSRSSGPQAGGVYLSIFGNVWSAPLTLESKVLFGGVPAQVLSASGGNYYPFSTEPDVPFLGVLAPPHAPGTVDVVVVNPDGQQATAVGAYTYR